MRLEDGVGNKKETPCIDRAKQENVVYEVGKSGSNVGDLGQAEYSPAPRLALLLLLAAHGVCGRGRGRFEVKVVGKRGRAFLKEPPPSSRPQKFLAAARRRKT